MSDVVPTLPASAADAPRRGPRHPWMPVVLGLATFLVVLVGLGLVVGDWVQRNLEMRSLIASIELSEAAMGEAQDSVRTAIEEYRAGEQSAAAKAALDESLKAAAQDGGAGVSHGGDLVAAVETLSWHADIRAAQDAYLAHNRAWQDYLAAASKDPAVLGQEQAAINTTFESAEAPLRSAVPMPPLFDLRERVDVIFAPPVVDDGGPTQEA